MRPFVTRDWRLNGGTGRITFVAVRGTGCYKAVLLASYPGLMKRLSRLAAPLLALAAFIVLGVMVLSMADVGADVMLDVLSSVGFN